MNALELLRAQAASVDDLLIRTMANVTAEQASWRPAGSTENPIVNKFLHVYHGEDQVVQRHRLNQPSIFETQGWKERLGYDPSAPWSDLAIPDLEAGRAYAAAVRAQTAAILESLDPAAVEREIDSFLGRRPVAVLLSVFLVTHKASHQGEIASLLGSQGVKGSPI